MINNYRKILFPAILSIVAILIVMGIHTQTLKTHGQTSANTQNQPAQLDWSKVGQTMGKSGEQMPGGVYKISLPRSDLQVSALGVRLNPGFALGTHIEFLRTGPNEVMTMGDLVLTQDEVGPVMQKLEQDGVEVTALHNHLLGETPRVLYMHIMSKGDPVNIARTIHNALALTGTPFNAASFTAENNTSVINLNTQELDQIMNAKGSSKNGIYQYSMPRPEKIQDQGLEIPPAMGVATAINFQPISNDMAIATGDFVLTSDEINSVIKVLTSNGIQVTAVHSHSLTEQPRLFYLHFLTKGDATKLSQALRLALNVIH